jgi:hypothetical protein
MDSQGDVLAKTSEITAPIDISRWGENFTGCPAILY